MRWAHDKARCGKCGRKFTGTLKARDKVQKHQNSKNGGSGKILFYDTNEEMWEDEIAAVKTNE